LGHGHHHRSENPTSRPGWATPRNAEPPSFYFFFSSTTVSMMVTTI